MNVSRIVKELPHEAIMGVAKTIVYALALALMMRTFVFQPFSIPSASMDGTLLTGDYILVSKYSYGYSRYSLPFSESLPAFGRILGTGPARGDVVVFRLPSDPSQDYVKRVIGLPGDRIKMSRGVVRINGTDATQRSDGYAEVECSDGIREVPVFLETLPDGGSYRVTRCNPMTPLNDVLEFTVPPGRYFVMGDNRDNSRDSRLAPASGGVGFVPAENIVGKAQAVFFSSNGSAGLLEVWRWPSAIRFSRLFHGVV